MAEEKRTKSISIPVKEVTDIAVNEVPKAIRNLSESLSDTLDAILRAAKVTLDTMRLPLSAVENVIKSISEETLNVLVISDISELTVSSSDLKSVDKPIVFKNIEKLVFTDDVTPELFSNKVKMIRSCGEVVVPKTIPKLLVLSKCRRVRRISSG